MSKTAERRGATEHRRRLLHGLAGTVAEVGAGNGLNFAHYPAEVAEVIALEPEPTLRVALRTGHPTHPRRRATGLAVGMTIAAGVRAAR
jgi:hypothetical protein